ncbi:hypothetical protein DQM68_02000 [Leptospira mayottensis]|uniref:Uncharacterized protein n=2 Tax=Leptospira mayottensis TaxID=1137606 RepID=A0AA87MKP9_9LEPT|nr:hypothetical protein DQM68_02000 [Leptospira mayottensis]AZQ01008.1 hypothetical protein LEP1GSC190_01975 [Leptospira mayottensis 200901116]EKR98971.1 hypothetical protein LEP1GSC125_2825 [Leptospira mayottensis 200901122]AXR63454.1 hypothetical protein DQM28_03630 [Leptospira mayottensis]AXR67220.1 hypothetical protein DPV73_03540 [Leptospira mayottensis]
MAIVYFRFLLSQLDSNRKTYVLRRNLKLKNFIFEFYRSSFDFISDIKNNTENFFFGRIVIRPVSKQFTNFFERS